jgi:predicted CopG family antitoxin
VFIELDMSKRISVGLRDDVYSRLRDKGRFGESFSELVARLLNNLEEGKEEIIDN